MIGLLSKGYSFRALADYLLLDDRRNPRGRIIGGLMAGKTPRELSREFKKLRALNPKLGRAVAHFVLSPSPDDPPLPDETLAEIAEKYIQEMGFEAAPWCAVAHEDSSHPHVHIMASRIGFDAKTISDAGDYRRSEKAIRRLELLYGLKVIASPPLNEAGYLLKVRKSEVVANVEAPAISDKTSKEQLQTKELAVEDSNDQKQNPFPPGSPLAATWPEAYEPGRDEAEMAMADIFETNAATASVGDELNDRKRREIRRTPHENAYEKQLQQIFPADTPAVFRYPRGVILYFRQPQPHPGRIVDRGDKLTAQGGMSDQLAAKRIVALATNPNRRWRSIVFDGSDQFVELGMREAMACGLTIHAKGQIQAEILARLMAEKRGGMGSNTGPVASNSDRHAIADDPILLPLRELDVLGFRGQGDQEPLQTSPRTAPSPKLVIPSPAPDPIVGVTPHFLNLRERIEDRRQQHSKIPQPNSPADSPKPPSSKRP